MQFEDEFTVTVVDTCGCFYVGSPHFNEFNALSRTKVGSRSVSMTASVLRINLNTNLKKTLLLKFDGLSVFVVNTRGDVLAVYSHVH